MYVGKASIGLVGNEARRTRRPFASWSDDSTGAASFIEGGEGLYNLFYLFIEIKCVFIVSVKVTAFSIIIIGVRIKTLLHVSCGST